MDSRLERSSRLTRGYIFLSSSAWQGNNFTRYGLLCGEKFGEARTQLRLTVVFFFFFNSLHEAKVVRKGSRWKNNGRLVVRLVCRYRWYCVIFCG